VGSGRCIGNGRVTLSSLIGLGAYCHRNPRIRSGNFAHPLGQPMMLNAGGQIAQHSPPSSVGHLLR
jgi:hypothetical protein